MKKQNSASEYAALRKKMVQDQLLTRKIVDRRVIKQMLTIPRHLFVPLIMRAQSYEDCALPIEESQTISQPYIVAFMSQLLDVRENDRVLEIGTGSGYQTAVLAGLAKSVYTVEIVPFHFVQAKRLLGQLGYGNIYFKLGDGTFGWRDAAPFDRIIVTAAPASVPNDLLEQLAYGGKMLAPVGIYEQDIIEYSKSMFGEISQRRLAKVRFVPMTGCSEQMN